jgi:hypothetical protein
MPISKEQAEKIQNSASARKERSNRNSKNVLPIVYIPDGTLQARFYIDSEGNYVKTFYRHKVNKPVKLSFQCLGPDRCKACQRLAEISGWKFAYQWASREQSIAYAYLLSYEGASSDFVKLETPVILMGNYKLANSLSEEISDLNSLDDIAKFFDPDELYARIKIKSTQRMREFSMKLLNNQPTTIPPLPDEIPPLSQIMYKEDDEPSSEVVARYIQLMEKAYEDWKQISEKESDDSDSGTRGSKASGRPSYPPRSEEPEDGDDDNQDGEEEFAHEAPASKPEEKPAPKPAAKPASKPAPAKTTTPSEPPVGGDASGQPANCPAAFGQKPDGFLPPCLTCPVDEECLRATQASA